MIESRKKLDRFLQDYQHAKRSAKEEAVVLEEAKQHVANVLEAQRLVQGVAEAVQHQAHQRIASVVSRCLEAVFGEEAYAFKIHFEQKRGKTEARLAFVRGDIEVAPCDGAGGGVVDVAAFALRLACLILSRPQRRRLLVLDEPFRFLSREYRPRVRDLLLTLSREMGAQIIMVTHAEDLVTGKVVEL